MKKNKTTGKPFKEVQVVVDVFPDNEEGRERYAANVAVWVNGKHDEHTDQLFFRPTWREAYAAASEHGACVAGLILQSPENPPRHVEISLKGGALVGQYHGCGRGWVEFAGKTEQSPPVRMRYADSLEDEGAERQDDYIENVDEDGLLTGANGKKVPAPQRSGERKIVDGHLRVYGNFSCWYFYYYLPELRVV